MTARRRRIDDAIRMRDLLRVEILAGRYGQCSQSTLPGEPELMLEYAVGRNTTRDALALLRDEGLIQRIPGSGTFVSATKAHHRFDRVHAIHDSVLRPRKAGGEMLTTSTVIAPGPVARTLGLSAGSPCYVLYYTATVGGASFSVTTSYVPPAIGALLAEAEFTGDFYRMLESVGVVVQGADMTVEAVAADSLASRQLGLDLGAPLLSFHRRLFSPDGVPVEVGFVRCRGDQLSLDIHLPRSREEVAP